MDIHESMVLYFPATVLLLPFDCILPITKDSYVFLWKYILIFYSLQSRREILHTESLYFNLVLFLKGGEIFKNTLLIMWD